MYAEKWVHMQESSQIRVSFEISLAYLGSLWTSACYVLTSNEISLRIHEQEAERGNIDVPSDIRSNCEVDSRNADVPLAC